MDDIKEIKEQLSELKSIFLCNSNNDRLLSVKEVSKKLSISIAKVYTLKDLPDYSIIGKNRRYSNAEINQYIHDKKTKNQ